KRAELSGPRFATLTITTLLGPSELLDAESQDWSEASSNMQLLTTYASEKTWARATRLHGTKCFMDEIGRKIHGALLLRQKVAAVHGHHELDAYSGATMVMRCGDANPRRVI